jgi:putative DNA primase/helicase
MPDDKPDIAHIEDFSPAPPNGKTRPNGHRFNGHGAADTAATETRKSNGTARQAARLLLDPKAPLPSAREFLARRYMREEVRTLHHHNGDFRAWTGTHYPEADQAQLRAELYDFLDSAMRATPDGKMAPFNPNRSKIADVIDALAAVANLPATVHAPAWLTHAADLPADEIVACGNGLLHLPTGDLLPHTPEFFAENALDFDYVPKASPPDAWLRFLDELWPDDPAAVTALQEIFGYLLTSDTRQQKAFLIVGPKRSGKGTIARILTRLVGPANVAGPTLASLGQNFGLAPLIGKRVAIISDARLGSRADQQVIAERLLAISGEDALTIDRKFRAAWTGRLQTRFVVLTNELPRLADASGAIASLFIVLALTASFYGREDHGLTDRLSTELPGILNWAIAGWGRLSAQHGTCPQARLATPAREETAHQ